MTKTIPTQDPIPSELPQNFWFNIANIDEFMNSLKEYYIDRFGENRYTAEGIRINLAPLGKVFPSLDGELGANIAIESGEIPNDSFFFVRSSDDGYLSDEYKNIDGMASFTNRRFLSDIGVRRLIDNIPSFATVVGDPNNTGLVFSFVRREDGRNLLGITADEKIINSDFLDVKKTANSAMKTIVVGDPNNTGLIVSWVDKLSGKNIFGWDADGMLNNRHIKKIDSKLERLESGGIPQLSKIAVHLISIFGQSNSVSSTGFSQVWRVPYPAWGAYPPGYSGEQDGDKLITLVQAGKNRTFNVPTPTALIPLANNIVFGSQAEGIGHGMLDSIVDVYPELELATFSHGVGGLPIQDLDKPTSKEIIAGNASSIVIPQTSAEYLMLQANQDITHILDYSFSSIASPYYKGMYLIAKTVALVALEDKRVICDMAWLQGETNYQDSGYQDLVYALYDDYSADVELLTQQPEKMLMLLEQSNYSDFAEQTGKAGYEAWIASGYSDAYAPGGVSSAYTPESARVNTHFALNQRQNAIVDEALERSPARLIYNVSPRYPYTSNIHMHPHAIRAYGEQFGKVWRKLRIENQQWQPLEPVSWWFDATSIFIQFNVPKGSVQFKWPDYTDIFGFVEKSTAPYGLEHSAGALQKEKITLSGRNVIRITPDVPPVPGQTISYLKSSRRGAICDTDNTSGIFTDRAGEINSLRNYCVPFSIKL